MKLLRSADWKQRLHHGQVAAATVAPTSSLRGA
jgi:hypothetical protein